MILQILLQIEGYLQVMDIHNFIEALVRRIQEISKQRKEEWMTENSDNPNMQDYTLLYNNINKTTYTTISGIIRSNITYREAAKKLNLEY